MNPLCMQSNRIQSTVYLIQSTNPAPSGVDGGLQEASPFAYGLFGEYLCRMGIHAFAIPCKCTKQSKRVLRHAIAKAWQAFVAFGQLIMHSSCTIYLCIGQHIFDICIVQHLFASCARHICFVHLSICNFAHWFVRANEHLTFAHLSICNIVHLFLQCQNQGREMAMG